MTRLHGNAVVLILLNILFVLFRGLIPELGIADFVSLACCTFLALMPMFVKGRD